MRKAVLILLLVILVASAAIVATWQTKSETVMADARSLLEQEVTNALGSQASVDAIKIQGVSSVAVTGIRLLDRQGELLATAEQLTVAFNPLKLLTGGNPLDAIYRVTVESPRLYLRQRADLSWNLDDLVQTKGSDGQAFSGLVSISRGWVSVETQQQGAYQADNLNGELDFAVRPSIQLDLKGNHQGAWFTVTGSVNGSSRDVLTINIDSLALPAYQAALPSQSLQITAGQARHATVTVIREKEVLTYSGEAYIQDLTAQVDDVHIDRASALVSFDHDTVHVYNANLHIWDQPVRVSGSILYQAAQPVFDVEVASEAFETSRLPVPADFGGQAAFTAQVKGTPADFQAQGRLSMAAGRYENYQFTHAETQFVYHGGLLRLTDAKARIYDGQLTADGIIDMESMASDLRLSGRGLDGAIPALAAGLADTGARVDFDAVLSGRFAAAEMNLTGTVTLGVGKAAGFAFDSGYGGFHLRQGVFTAEYFNTVVKSGTLSAKGSYDINLDKLDMTVDSHHLPLEALTATLPAVLHSSGSLEFTARVSGKLAAPQLELTLAAEAGSIVSQPYERLTGTVAVSGDKLLLRDILAVNGSTEHLINGSMHLAGTQSLDLTITTRKARMEDILKPLSLTEVVTGNVDNELRVTGTFDNPSVAGRITLTDGSWRGYLLTSVNGAYSLHDGLVTLEDAAINSLDNHLNINGTVTTNGKLALELIGREIDLARLPAPYPYPVDGKAQLAVNLTGTVDQPHMTGEVMIPRMTANGQVFENVEAAINWDGVVLHCPQASFSQGSSTFNLTGGINLQSDEIYGSLRAEKAQASSIAALANIDAKMLQGEMNGYFTWSGNLANPNAAFSGTVVNGIVKGYTVGDIEMEAVLANRVIDLDKFMVTQNEGLMAAKGRIDLQGDINIEVGARDIDAAFFAKLFDANLETQGKLSFTAQISGKTKKPHTAVSLEISQGRVANASFDTLYGLFILDQGIIQVSQLMLAKGEYKASAYGVIPLAALNKEGRRAASAADEMDMTFRLDQADLSILPFLSKAVSSASGETKGEIKVTGNLFQPSLQGEITVTDGTVKFIDLAEPIQKVTVDIQLKDDTIQVRTFEGSVGTGKVQLVGTVAVRDMALHDYDLSLLIDKISLSHTGRIWPATCC